MIVGQRVETLRFLIREELTKTRRDTTDVIRFAEAYMFLNAPARALVRECFSVCDPGAIDALIKKITTHQHSERLDEHVMKFCRSLLMGG